MPLIDHNNLPSFSRLRNEGQIILTKDKAEHQSIRELHIGLLNMMPDAALEATERQFFRLIGESNPIAQFYVHPFTLPNLERGSQAQKHINQYYETFDEIKQQGLDALVITGANVSGPDLSIQPFWNPLIEVIDWAYDNVTSTLCSCLATHAVLEFRYGKKRIPQPDKIWGVFPHHVVNKTHPLVWDINTRFDVPHSRWNAITREQFDEAGLHVLAESQEIGVHLATSEDGFRFVFFQGHPEYDTISLLKEYKRDLLISINNGQKNTPPFPQNYFQSHEMALLDEFRNRLINSHREGKEPPEFPEALISGKLDNTWHDTAEAVVGNWMGCIYQVTHTDRNKPFMDNVNPDDPLDICR
ncbi:MAG: homoserine O-succinyltransferase [Gammaproteobacteria bacterium]|nr:MAG: homoserine O-succinyltransferase [Gammaproteobacteria bacterium]